MAANYTTQDWKPVGWVKSPDGRGTIDILWSCAVTIVLCTWSVVCVNVSAPSRGSWRLFIRKIWLAMMCTLGPEFLLSLAIGQWQSARKSVKSFHDLGFDRWSMKHAFYADMGGYHLRTKDPMQFPLDNNKLLYLIKEGYLSHERVEKEIVLMKRHIEDKNKADNTVRMITTIQTLWFVVNIVGRAIQHLTITTMELTVCGFIVTTLPVIFFWSHKPADIATAEIIHLDVTSDEIRERAGGRALDPWFRTPMDFVDEPQAWLSLGWFYFVHILRRMHLMPWRNTQLVDKIHDDNFLEVTGWRMLIVVLSFTSFCLAINLSAWNFWFPTPIERELWRASAVLTAATIWIGAIHCQWLVPATPERERIEKFIHSLPGMHTNLMSRALRKAETTADRFRNNTADHDPAFDVSLRLIIPGILIAAVYSIARVYQLIDSIVNLRSQPPDAYNSVDWNAFLPHA